MSRRGAIIALGSLLLLGALASGARVSVESEPAFSTRPTDSTLVVGVVANRNRAASGGEADFLRGIRIWRSRVESAGDLIFGPSHRLPIRLLIRDAGPSGASARAAVRALAREGVTVLLGPGSGSQVEDVAAAARRFRTLALIPFARPVGTPRSMYTYFFFRPDASSGSALYDVLAQPAVAKLRSRTRHDAAPGLRPPRIAIVAKVGGWADIGRRAARTAAQRGYPASLTLVRGADPRAALARARRSSPDLLYTLARPREIRRWRGAHAAAADPPWASWAPDANAALEASGPHRIAVTVPWSPLTTAGGDVLFPPRGFANAYRSMFGRHATQDAAAGAATGTALTHAILLARSSDAGRLAKALDAISSPSFFGTLRFVDHEQTPWSPSVVLAGPGRSLGSIWPDPANPGLILHASPRR